MHRFDSDPKQFEASLVGVDQAASLAALGLASPKLAPACSAQQDGDRGFVAVLFDASPCIHGAVVLERMAQEEEARAQHTDAVAFDVMELEYLASSNPPSSDDDGSEDNYVADAPSLTVI